MRTRVSLWRLLAGAALAFAAGAARAEAPAVPDLGWTIVGFTADGDHVVFEHERGQRDCLSITLEIFRADDNRHVVSVPLAGLDPSAPGCVERGDGASFTRAVDRVAEVFGPVAVPRRLYAVAGVWRDGGVRLALEAQPRLPATGCEAVTEAMRGRAYLRLELTRGERIDTLGRLVELAPVADPLVAGCLGWPRLALSQAALRPDGARLAAVVAGLPLVFPLP